MYTPTLVVVRTEFLEDHPDVVESFLRGHIETLDRIAEDASAARETVNAGIKKLTDKPLADNVIEAAWKNLEFTYDPLVSTIEQSAAAAENVGLLDSGDIKGIANLGPLNEVLGDAGKKEVSR
jgi:NitT/TauT family transport system substrate-binding protein